MALANGQVEEEEEFEVENILDKRKRQGGTEYLIKWLGYGDEHNTWEPEENLECQDAILEFEANYEKNKQNNKKRRKRKKSDVDFKSQIRIDSKFVEIRKGEYDTEFISKMKKETDGIKMVEELKDLKLSDIKDPNVPFKNHWADPEKIGFNRDLTPKQIHETFRDTDGQSKYVKIMKIFAS